MRDDLEKEDVCLSELFIMLIDIIQYAPLPTITMRSRVRSQVPSVYATTFGYKVNHREIVATSKSAYRSTYHKKLKTIVNNRAASGKFSAKLPGRVQANSKSTYTHNDGMLWGVVYKEEGGEENPLEVARIE